jgi:hypothetical protein
MLHIDQPPGNEAGSPAANAVRDGWSWRSRAGIRSLQRFDATVTRPG